MVGNGSGTPIVRIVSIPGAPTGEGTGYVDERGTVWVPTRSTERPTGSRRARIVNGSIVEHERGR